MNHVGKVRGEAQGGVHTSQPHDSALKHTTGAAIYVDDIPEPPRTVHAALVLSPVAHGRLLGLETAQAQALPGVIEIIVADDIPGENDVAPVLTGEPLLARDVVEYAGQPVAIVVARTMDIARAAAGLVRVVIEPLEPILTVAQAMAAQSLLLPPKAVVDGDVAAAMAKARHRLSAKFAVGGQEHFYLEGQIALAIPGEDQDLTIHSSTQHPTEVQHICGRLLGIDLNRIAVTVRRLGGAFGGKESNASWVAGAAAVAAWRTRRPVKLRLPRTTDMIATGKRHGFDISYEIGFDDSGRITALDSTLSANGGFSVDLTPAALTRALTHVDNCYSIPHFRAQGFACKTHTVSNTAFRGFGGPQGVVLMEDAVARIACHLGLSAEQVREANYYGPRTASVTPYGQRIRDNLIQECVTQVLRDSEWTRRRAGIDAFNRTSPIVKRGLGLFPLKYGISFSAKQFNQAGAVVHIYTDGSIRLNHGGIEMGQGLFVKVAQIVAETFQVDLDRVRVSPTSTAEVPNTAPTAASTGTDLNGAAALNAAGILKGRMIAFAAAHFGVEEKDVVFRDNHVHIGPPGANRVLEFGEFAHLCWMERISLSSTGFYKVPSIHWDPVAMKGEPFFYFVYGAAVAEVAVDTLTGETKVLRADLVQDCGHSLNSAIDVGQIEGAFVQGMGWLTCEELWWDGEGRLRTVGPSTYKIPGSRDAPEIFNVRILEDRPAVAETVFRSKGVGEPPLMLAVAVWVAIKDAIASVASGRIPVELDIPATPERVLLAVQGLKR